MGWVKDALAALAEGRAVEVRPQGGRSMAGRVDPGQRVTLEPLASDAPLTIGDVVLVLWKGNHILHVVHDVRGAEVLIGNALGTANGWVPRTDVVARAVAIQGGAPPDTCRP